MGQFEMLNTVWRMCDYYKDKLRFALYMDLKYDRNLGSDYDLDIAVKDDMECT